MYNVHMIINKSIKFEDYTLNVAGSCLKRSIALMGLSTPSLAKKQFNVREELAAYNEACNSDSNRRLLETLESEPEAREFCGSNPFCKISLEKKE